MTLDLATKIRDVPNFPKPGIIFKDITPLLKDVRAFQSVIDTLARRYADKRIDLVLGIEARGFIFASALAYRLDAGFIPIRKKGKLPYTTDSVEYLLEYGTDRVEMHTDAVAPGARVVVVDDLIATGGTIEAACKLVERQKGVVVECAFVIELKFLNGRDRLKGQEVFSLIQY